MLVRRALAVSLCCVVAVSVLAGCASSERAAVNLSYVVDAERGLPPGMETIAIQPAKIGPTTDPKWSDMSATILQSLVNESRTSFGTKVTVSDRRDTQVVWDEADLKAAGMSTAKGGGGGQLLAAQGMILSNINVKVEKHVGKQRTLAGLSLDGWGGHGWGGGGTDIRTEEVETVSRNMTVQTEFKLLDTANNKVWDHYMPATYRATEKTKASPIFGSSKTEAELTPEDAIIATLVERGAREFISRLMPVRVDVEVEVVSSGSANCVQGVKQLRGEMYREALSSFEAALAAKPEDDRAAFGAGVACEALGQFDRALHYYKMAAAADSSPKYQDAMGRMKTFGQRIRSKG